MIRSAGVALCACAALPSAYAQSNAHFARIVGVVADSVSGAPLRGADVLASGVTTPARTDSLGRFMIDSLAPGTYQVAVFHPLLESLDITLTTKPFSVGGDSAGVVTLAVPSIPTLVRRYCAASVTSYTPSVIAGRVIDPDTDEPVAGASVSLRWEEIFISKTTGVVHTPHEVHAETNSMGFFKLCGLPSDVGGTLQVHRAGIASPEIPVDLNGALLDFQSVYVPKQFAATGAGVVSGHVVSPAGKPVPGAKVEIPMASVSAVTMADGSFRFTDLPGGTMMIVGRSAGYSTAAQPIDVSSRQALNITITLVEKTTQANPVTVRPKFRK